MTCSWLKCNKQKTVYNHTGFPLKEKKKIYKIYESRIKKIVLSYSSVVCQDFTEWLHHNRGQGQISVFYVTSGICQLPVINVNVLFKLLHISDSVGIYYMNEKFSKELMWKRKICTLSTLKSLREIFYMVLIVSLLFPS